VKRLEIEPELRYSVARDKFSGTVAVDWRTSKTTLRLEGGRFISQYNHANPIHEILNGAILLLASKNWMKIYERNFVDFTFLHRYHDRLTLSGNLSFNQRRELFNNTSYTLFKSNEDLYTPNQPVNIDAPTGFSTHQALLGNFRMDLRP
jgi:hypothetical protein